VTRTGLDQVAARGMAELDGGRIVFRHELARLAVEDALLPGHRRQLHTVVLDGLEGTAGIDPARLVHHAVEAGDRQRILAHARTAADAAEARGAYRVAAAHLERAIDVADDLPAREQAELWDRLADQRLLFDFTAQIDLREQVIRRWQQVGDREREALQRCFLAGTLDNLGDRSRAAEVLNRARALVADRPSSPAARTVRATWLDTFDGRRPAREQADAWEQLGEDARRSEDHETRVWALAQAAVAHVHLGNVDRALHLLERSAEVAEHTHRPAAVGETNVGEALCQCRHHELAERLLQPVLDDERRHEAATLARYAGAVLARVHLERGRWTEARATVAPIVEDAETDRLEWSLAVAVLDRLDVHEAAAVPHRLSTAWDVVRDTANIDFMWPVAVACAEDAWGRGDRAAAVDPVLATLDVARATEHPWAVGELTWWARQAGHDPAVEVEVAEPWAAALAGDWAGAADAWAALGCPLDEAIALASGDLPAQRRALDLFIELGATADADRLRQRLRDAGATDLPARDRPRAGPGSVTVRQLQVLELVAAGLTNAAIAQRLYITEKTVGHHVSAILARLGARTRTQAVAVARQRGLLPD
jgi:DNA-binding CsgD family transcriptional regulator/tetratricopeptide (TPR) repeat protein